MALNLDDLIGSMQQVHAGDRGQGLEEIRENLRATLGQQALGPCHPHAGPSSSRQISSGSANSKRRTSTPQHRSGGGSVGQDGLGWVGGSSLDDTPMQPPGSYVDQDMAVGMLGYQQGSAELNGFHDRGNAPRSYSSNASGGHHSNGSYQSGAGSSGFGFAQAPANTPMQTPSDRIGSSPYQQQWHQRPGGHLEAVAEDRAKMSLSPNAQPQHQQQHHEHHQQMFGGRQQDFEEHLHGRRHDRSSPKKLVNGFEPSPIR
ncbi:hypothetical protein BDZ90DRAFT_39218 [Jaminaea rosea]|uniref:Uncharacterized protein n=1 Tax=Jaminaea rosea TaxID=1569628 RepID=A0A316UTN9_9BASI|nr:hypothetical protein BDZ90DRAFT_39218 [Jaminaea rosea]PWN26455.1 hypothetical protein BDZ90DRAFT_39218 [Jaminaea rosea]